MSRTSRWRTAADDVATSLRRSWLWTALGWNDVRNRFSGSILGSLWITANLAMMVIALTLVFAHSMGSHWSTYAPYVAIGLVLWQFVQASLNEAAAVFVSAGEAIRHAPMPLTIHVLRLLWRNLITLGHNVVVVAATLIIFQVAPAMLWSVAPALLVLTVAVFSASFGIGLIGARFRDVGQVVTNLLQLMFFVTPIFWLPETLGDNRSWIVSINPVFALIDIVRAPLLGAPPAPLSWAIAALSATLAAGFSFVAFAYMRSRIAYWV